MKILVSISAPDWIPDDTDGMHKEMQDPKKRQELSDLVRHSITTTKVQYLGKTWFNMKTTVDHQEWLVLFENGDVVACLVYIRARLLASKAIYERATWNAPTHKGTIRDLLLRMLESTDVIVSDEEHTSAGRKMWLKMCEASYNSRHGISLARTMDPRRQQISYPKLLEIQDEIWSDPNVRICLERKGIK